MKLTPAEERMLAMLGEKGKAFSLVDANTVFVGMAGLIGASFVNVVTVTEPKMNKTGNPYFGRVAKVASTNGQVNFDYGGAVDRAREKEGVAEPFEGGESWHEPVKIDGRFTPFCRHKKTGDVYVRLRRLGGTSVYVDKSTGNEVSKEVLKPFLPKSSYENQGLDKPVEFLTYKLDSIRAATFGGQTFLVR